MAVDMNNQSLPFISPDTGALDPFDGGGTIMGRARIDAASTGLFMFARNAALASAWGFRCNFGASGDGLTQLFVGASGGAGIWRTNNIVPRATWVHIGLTYDSTILTTAPVMYVDGQSVSVNVILTPSGARLTADGDIVVGSTLTGAMSDFRLINRTLTPSEMQSHFYSPFEALGETVRHFPLGPMYVDAGATPTITASDASIHKEDGVLGAVTVDEDFSPYPEAY